MTTGRKKEAEHRGGISSDWQSLAKSSQEREGLTLESPPTLVVGLWRLGDVDGELAAEGVHPHHPGVRRSVGESGDLVVVAGHAV